MTENITCAECARTITDFASLCESCRRGVDSSKGVLDATRELRDRTGAWLSKASWLVSDSGLSEKRAIRWPTFHEITNEVESWRAKPEAIEAHWTADTVTWWLVVSAALPRLGPRRSHQSRIESRTLFFAAESKREEAAALARRTANYFRLPFWFPSPEEPVEGTPTWHERDLDRP